MDGAWKRRAILPAATPFFASTATGALGRADEVGGASSRCQHQREREKRRPPPDPPLPFSSSSPSPGLSLSPPPLFLHTAGQFWAAAAFFVSRGGSVPQALAGASLPRLAAAVAAIAAGQALNLAVYATIGGDGVYYGTRLGKRVPWVHGFPFALGGGGKVGKGVKVPHPQYLGSALTAAGGLALLWHGAPAGSAAVVGYWTGLYVVTAIQEDLL